MTGSDYYVLEPCSSSNGMEIKLKNKKIALNLAESAFLELGTVAANTGVVLLTKIDEYTVSVYASGRMMVKAKKKPKQKDIEKLAQKIIVALEKYNSIIEGKE